jgi:hypothetical protein
VGIVSGPKRVGLGSAIENLPKDETNVCAPTTDGASRWWGASIENVIAMMSPSRIDLVRKKLAGKLT